MKYPYYISGISQEGKRLFINEIEEAENKKRGEKGEILRTPANRLVTRVLLELKLELSLQQKWRLHPRLRGQRSLGSRNIGRPRCPISSAIKKPSPGSRSSPAMATCPTLFWLSALSLSLSLKCSSDEVYFDVLSSSGAADYSLFPIRTFFCLKFGFRRLKIVNSCLHSIPHVSLIVPHDG